LRILVSSFALPPTPASPRCPTYGSDVRKVILVVSLLWCFRSCQATAYAAVRIKYIRQQFPATADRLAENEGTA